ncbi:MAG: hypothetical protein KDI79_31420 [Anaerolineae bacterium]|nr:hypothetical protein [Anaerolineae bacterium]
MGVTNYAKNTAMAKGLSLSPLGYKTYPPYVLIFGDKSSTGLKLEKQLERNGCRVSRTESIADGLNIACQQLFDLIVFNLDQQDDDDSLAEAYEKLASDPKLTNTPVVIITSQEQVNSHVAGTKPLSSVYYLSHENSSETNLLQIATHSQYMSHRYM